MLFYFRSAFILFFALFFGAAGLVHAEEKRPEVAKYVNAYSGGRGISVGTVRIGPLAAKEVLLQISGIDHAWDLKIFKAKLVENDHRETYVIQVDGRDFAAFLLNGNAGEIYLSGQKNPIGVSYDKSLSEAANAEHFLTDYLTQQESAKKK